jgi:transcriptional regulator with XRE-family HTH domain
MTPYRGRAVNVSIFGTWLQSELDARGWDARTAAAALGVKDNTVHYWLSGAKLPSIKSVLVIARKLGIPVNDVLLKAGYADVVEQAHGVTADEAAQARAQILAQLPQFAEIIEVMAKEPPERQAVQIEIIRRLLLSPPG